MWLRIYLPALVGRRERIEPVCPRRAAGQDITPQAEVEPREAHGGE
jgi:hypothetical protein